MLDAGPARGQRPAPSSSRPPSPRKITIRCRAPRQAPAAQAAPRCRIAPRGAITSANPRFSSSSRLPCPTVATFRRAGQGLPPSRSSARAHRVPADEDRQVERREPVGQRMKRRRDRPDRGSRSPGRRAVRRPPRAPGAASACAWPAGRVTSDAPARKRRMHGGSWLQRARISAAPRSRSSRGDAQAELFGRAASPSPSARAMRLPSGEATSARRRSLPPVRSRQTRPAESCNCRRAPGSPRARRARRRSAPASRSGPSQRRDIGARRQALDAERRLPGRRQALLDRKRSCGCAPPGPRRFRPAAASTIAA